jgi:hypothetical protein
MSKATLDTGRIRLFSLPWPAKRERAVKKIDRQIPNAQMPTNNLASKNEYGIRQNGAYK